MAPPVKHKIRARRPQQQKTEDRAHRNQGAQVVTGAIGDGREAMGEGDEE